MSHVRQINSLAELESYRLLWNALLPRTRGATFFHSYDWLATFWRHFGEEQQLRVLIVYEGDEPIGIVPLVVKTEDTRAGKVRVLTYPLHDWGSFYGPIGSQPTLTLRAAMRYLRQTKQDWDMLDLRWVDQSRVDHGRTKAGMQSAGFVPVEQAWNESAVIDMEGTWKDYWMSRTPKWRKNVCRNTRRLGERGRVSFLRYRPEGAAYGDGDPRWDLYDACVELARQSWQGSAQDGTTLCHEGVAPFLRDVHAAAARTGALDLCLLLVDGKPVAFIYCYYYQGRIYGLRMGFDPAWAEVGPGTVLLGKMIEDSYARGDEHLDLGVGYMACKEKWLTDRVKSYRYTHFSGSLRAQALRLKRWYVGKRYGANYLAGDPRRAGAA
ncbi:MAG: GNAT family N-acetyltransferase [Pirellulales bacterium]|nr:GNAT family N-acetyltransferase [Pirellulales bacterium]